MRRIPLVFLASLVLIAADPARAQDAGRVQIVTGGGVTFIGSAPAEPSQQPARDAQQTPVPGTAILRGRVFAGDTAQPLRKAQVRIISNGPAAPGRPPENRLATTDANGRYEFTAVRGGRYTLSAQKGSYISLQWGQQRPNQPGRPIDVLDGQTIERLDFALPRGGVITGRVFDEFGEPLSDVQVSALRPQTVGGTRRLVNVGRSAATNDIGEFRLFALPPGEYFLSATLRNVNPLAETEDRSGYAPTYYPGTPDVAVAQKLPIGIGQTISDITLSLLPVRTSRVTGVAVDSQNRPLRGVVQAVPRSSAVLGPFGVSPGQIRPDGSFTINSLTPGDYTLEVPPLGGPMASVDAEYAAVDVTVDTTDLTGVRIVGARPPNVSGRIVIGSGDARSLRTSGLRVGSAPVQNGSVMFGPFPQPGAVNEDWTFQLKARPGVMRLNVQGLQPPWNVRAVRYRGADATDSGLEIKSGEDLGDIEIELTDRTTDVSGTVTNARGEAVKDYLTVLFPRDPQKWKPQSRSVRVGRSDQEGRYKVAGLPAGEYFALADASLDVNDATDPEFLERAQSRATRFTLGEGETKVLDLKLSSTP